jgi:Domain of unknown function (DUF4153)
MTTSAYAVNQDGWPLRPWLFGALGFACGMWFHAVGQLPVLGMSLRLLVALTVLIGTTLFALTFTLEKARWQWSVRFSLGLGILLALLSFWVVGARPDVEHQVESMVVASRLLAATLFALLAIPFFQTLQQEPKLCWRLWQLPYAKLHDFAWSDAVLFFAAWLFVALVWLMLFLWASLFQLIGVGIFSLLFTKAWLLWPVLTAAWVIGVALLRDWPRVVLPLRSVMLTILSVLAPVVAAFVLLWIIFLPFTGLAPLWATRSATPLLITVAAFALLLANAVIRDEALEEPKSRLLRSSGRVLSAVLLPLCIIAAISLSIRIKQYGWTPERCYGALLIAIAMIYPASYAGLLLARWKLLRFNLNVLLAQ